MREDGCGVAGDNDREGVVAYASDKARLRDARTQINGIHRGGAVGHVEYADFAGSAKDRRRVESDSKHGVHTYPARVVGRRKVGGGHR